MRAVGYVRVSTGEQAREGYSLAAQEQAIRDYCRAHSWELVEVYTDAGRSGKDIKGRAELTRLLSDAEDGSIGRVVFWRLDRLGRNLRDLLDICDRLESCNVGVVSIQESIDTGTPAGRMMRSVLGSLAEFERESIQERIVAGMAEKARSGEILGPLPLGYRRDQDGAVELEPVVAPLVRDAFARYATGLHSLREMADWMRGIGLRSTEGNLLDRLSIRKILTNVTYTGHVAYRKRRGGDAVVKGKHPALVAPATFATVQETLMRRRRRIGPQRPYGREPYPLSGVALCSRCSEPMLGSATTIDKKYHYRHMRCSTAHRRGKGACEQPMVRAELLEGQLAAYVSDIRLPPEYLGDVVRELRRRQAAVSDADELPRLQREVERWRRLFVMGEIDEERYRRETAPLRRRLAELDRPQQVLDVEKAVHYLRDVGTLWAESPRLLQREFVREVFQRIVITDQEIESITPTDLYGPLFALDRENRFGGVFCSMAPRAGLEPAT